MSEKIHARSLPIICVLWALALPTQAQVVKQREFKLNAPRDRGILFSVVATPSGDILSVIANSSGEWQLYRVKNWLNSSPLEEKLLLPGYFSKADKKDLESLSVGVYVTRDGAYAVCVGSAHWLKRVGGRPVGNSSRSDDMISVVDLASYRVVASTRTSALDLYDAHGVTLDNDGYVRVSSLSSGTPKHDAFVRLKLPSLLVGPRCTYDWYTDTTGKFHMQATASDTCLESLKPKTLEEYFDEKNASFGPAPKECENNSSKFCHAPLREFAADRKFGVAQSTEGHDNIFGSWVTTSNTYIIFSTERRTDVGEIKAPTDDTERQLLTFAEGRDYLVLIQDGTLFSVYELRD